MPDILPPVRAREALIVGDQLDVTAVFSRSYHAQSRSRRSHFIRARLITVWCPDCSAFVPCNIWFRSPGHWLGSSVAMAGSNRQSRRDIDTAAPPATDRSVTAISHVVSCLPVCSVVCSQSVPGLHSRRLHLREESGWRSVSLPREDVASVD